MRNEGENVVESVNFFFLKEKKSNTCKLNRPELGVKEKDKRERGVIRKEN